MGAAVMEVVFLASSPNSRSLIWLWLEWRLGSKSEVSCPGILKKCRIEVIAGIELTRIPTVGSTMDQSMGTPIAYVASALTRSGGRKARRIQEVMTALGSCQYATEALREEQIIQGTDEETKKSDCLSLQVHLERLNYWNRQKINRGVSGDTGNGVSDIESIGINAFTLDRGFECCLNRAALEGGDEDVDCRIHRDKCKHKPGDSDHLWCLDSSDNTLVESDNRELYHPQHSIVG